MRSLQIGITSLSFIFSSFAPFFFLHHIYPEKICVNLMFRAVCRTHLQNNPDYRWFYEKKKERNSQVPRRWSV